MSELAVITGTTHGIGRVTCRELARAGKTVVMLCRDLKAAAAVRAEVRRHAPRARLEAVHCDLASLASVRQAAAVVRGYPNLRELSIEISNTGLNEDMEVQSIHLVMENSGVDDYEN